MILPCDGSGRCKVRRDPDAVMICCSFVPANCPRIACVVAVGGWIVKLYMNMEEVVAIVLVVRRKSAQLSHLTEEVRVQLQCICRELTRQLVEAQIMSSWRTFVNYSIGSVEFCSK